MEGGASSDPFLMNELWRSDQWGNNAGYQDVNGKTLRSAAITSKTLILFTIGDSNMAGVNATQYTPINTQSVDNLNIYDGAVYNGADPMLGHSLSNTLGNGSIPPRLADKIMNGNVYDRVIVVPMAIGGSQTSHWAVGGVLYRKPIIGMLRLNERGITPSTANCTFCAVIQIGANEHGISISGYQSNINSLVTGLKSAGFVGKIFIPVYSILNGVPDSNITAAQTGLVDNVTFFDGGNLDQYTGTAYRQSDNTHFNTLGQSTVAQTIYAKMNAVGLA
jgi:hypothetical protein